jgi:hypothetical protein
VPVSMKLASSGTEYRVASQKCKEGISTCHLPHDAVFLRFLLNIEVEGDILFLYVG